MLRCAASCHVKAGKVDAINADDNDGAKLESAACGPLELLKRVDQPVKHWLDVFPDLGSLQSEAKRRQRSYLDHVLAG